MLNSTCQAERTCKNGMALSLQEKVQWPSQISQVAGKTREGGECGHGRRPNLESIAVGEITVGRGHGKDDAVLLADELVDHTADLRGMGLDAFRRTSQAIGSSGSIQSAPRGTPQAQTRINCTEMDRCVARGVLGERSGYKCALTGQRHACTRTHLMLDVCRLVAYGDLSPWDGLGGKGGVGGCRRCGMGYRGRTRK